jgi:hypothetical protein
MPARTLGDTAQTPRTGAAPRAMLTSMLVTAIARAQEKIA